MSPYFHSVLWTCAISLVFQWDIELAKSEAGCLDCSKDRGSSCCSELWWALTSSLGRKGSGRGLPWHLEDCDYDSLAENFVFLWGSLMDLHQGLWSDTQRALISLERSLVRMRPRQLVLSKVEELVRVNWLRVVGWGRHCWPIGVLCYRSCWRTPTSAGAPWLCSRAARRRRRVVVRRKNRVS